MASTSTRRPHSAPGSAQVSPPGANIQLGDLDGCTAPPERAYGVLARARRNDRPGVVFARAAARGEVDPLEDIDARILCGLPVK